MLTIMLKGRNGLKVILLLKVMNFEVQEGLSKESKRRKKCTTSVGPKYMSCEVEKMIKPNLFLLLILTLKIMQVSRCEIILVEDKR